MRLRGEFIWFVFALGALLSGCETTSQPLPAHPAPPTTPTPSTPSAASPLVGANSPMPVPAPDHIVVVVEENHSYAQIAGAKNAPYIHSLMQRGANFVQSYAVEHPSQPNYLDLFSGSNQGVTNDSCPNNFSSPNLGSQLLLRGFSFVGYSEDLPQAGFTGCSNGHFWSVPRPSYARKHNPWVDFSNLPASVNQPFSAFPTDYSRLPTVSFVIPNLNHDMHNGSIQAGDTWLKAHLDSYVEWAIHHNSLLIVTWDEDDTSQTNHIPTILVGPMVRSGVYTQRINHFNLLRSLESFYGLSPLGEAQSKKPILEVWNQTVKDR